MARYQYLKCHFRDDFLLPEVMTILNKPSFILASKIKGTSNFFFNFGTVHIQFRFPLVREVCKKRFTYTICNVF